VSKLVDSSRIEKIVGVERHDSLHYAKAVSAEQTVYILHSRQCLLTGVDLRRCAFSRALDRGIDVERWPEDRPVPVVIERARLVPSREPRDQS
jgi:hypothetical protein